MLSVLRWTVRSIRAVASVVVVVCFAYMTVAVLAQVFGRYVFNYSISWTEETAKFAQIWVVFIGAGITMRFGWHVAVDVLAGMLSLRLARGLSVAIGAGCIGFLAIVVYGSLDLIELGWMFETSPVLQIPMWIIYLCIPIGAIYFALEIAISIVDRWDRPFGARTDAQIEASR
ncbi:MAG: TRAP transporter small permease [Gammaproteobacteria bacterium]